MDRENGWAGLSQFGFDVDWVPLRRIRGFGLGRADLGRVGLWRSELGSIRGPLTWGFVFSIELLCVDVHELHELFSMCAVDPKWKILEQFSRRRHAPLWEDDFTPSKSANTCDV